MRSAPLAALEAHEAHRRFAALQEAAATEWFQAIPRIAEMLADDAPVVSRGERPIVFQMRMHALTVLQHLCRVGNIALDVGPVRVTRGMPVTEVEARAFEALDGLPADARRELLSKIDKDIGEHVRPPDGDKDVVRAYRVLQYLDMIPYEVQEVDPKTLLTPLQEQLFASQVKSEPAGMRLRIGTAEPERTLGWVTPAPDGRLLINVSDHPLAQTAKEDLAWFDENTVDDGGADASVRLQRRAEFLQKRGLVGEVRS